MLSNSFCFLLQFISSACSKHTSTITSLAIISASVQCVRNRKFKDTKPSHIGWLHPKVLLARVSLELMLNLLESLRGVWVFSFIIVGIVFQSLADGGLDFIAICAQHGGIAGDGSDDFFSRRGCIARAWRRWCFLCCGDDLSNAISYELLNVRRFLALQNLSALRRHAADVRVREGTLRSL